MTLLQNFPMVSQLTQITGDGKPSENAQFDCVAASIDAACRYLLGTPENTVFNPDSFKDAVYGENYKGGTAASAYVEFCASLGIHLYAQQGIPGQLVQMAHAYLQQNKPVIFTEPDPYVSSDLGWSHVCVFYGEEPGFLVALDPYIAKPVRRTDQEWTQLLLFNQIWVLERIANEMPLSIGLNQPEVATYFDPVPTNPEQWRCKQTGKIIQYGILAFYRSYGNKNLCGLTFLGLPKSNEIPIAGTQGAVKQYFERGVVCYDPSHKIDQPPGAESVYLLQLYNGGAGQDPLVAELQSQVDQLKKQPAMPQLYADMQQLKEIVGKY